MLTAQFEFDRRKTEIDDYISHLKTLEDKSGLSIPLMNTMKSSALLMMYNIVESTMTNLVQDLFDHLHKNNVAFDSLNDIMKTLVLTYSKKHNPEKLVQKMRGDGLSLVMACFDRSNLFSGNLDCKKIRETLKEVGIQPRFKDYGQYQFSRRLGYPDFLRNPLRCF